MKQLFFVERGLGGMVNKGMHIVMLHPAVALYQQLLLCLLLLIPKMSDKKMGISLYFPSELLPNMIGRGLILFCSQYCCLLIA